MKNILVIDNHPLLLRLMTDLLVNRGYSVRTAPDGLAALDVLEEFTPDIIFLDLIMPNIPGEKLCRIIRSRPRFSDTFIVVLSGTAMEEDLDFKGFGADACIAKGPFKVTEAHILGVLAGFAAGERRSLGEGILGRDSIYQRRVTRELLAAKRHTEIIFANMAESLLEFAGDGRIVYANPASVALTETAEVELLSSPFLDLFAGPDRERVDRLIQGLDAEAQSIDERHPVRIKEKTVTLNLFPTAGSEFRTTVAIMRDITRQKKTEQELIDSRERYQDLFENAHDLIQIVNPDGRLLYVNRSWRDTLGYGEEEIKTLTIFDIIDPGCSSDCRNIFEEVLEKGSVSEIKSTFQARDGRKISVEGAANCKYIDGRPSLTRCIFRDVSERKELESQLLQSQKMEAVGTLAGGIAHDFNNILTSIMGYTQLALRETPAGSNAGDSLKHIAKSARRASDLVQQILTFCRKSSTEKAPVFLSSIAKEVLKLIRLSLPATIDIQQDIDSSSLPVLADITQIHQVIMNLCTNAYQAMRTTGGVLRVEVCETLLDDAFLARHPELSSNHCLTLTVSDTGSGIEPAHLDRIFEPYFTTKGPSEGTGLGLAIVHGIVKNHHGLITVSSEVGRGTRFTVYLPAHQELTPREYKEVEFALPRLHGSVMFVDDEADIAEMVHTALSKTGATVAAFTSSLAALEAFEKDPGAFDVVITDQNMPHLSGLELARKILACRPDIPVILCTGFSETLNDQGIGSTAIRQLLEKPLNIDRLAWLIKNSLPEEK